MKYTDHSILYFDQHLLTDIMVRHQVAVAVKGKLAVLNRYRCMWIKPDNKSMYPVFMSNSLVCIDSHQSDPHKLTDSIAALRNVDKILLRRRYIIETVNDQLKNISQIEHSRHRSPANFLVNLTDAVRSIARENPKLQSVIDRVD